MHSQSREQALEAYIAFYESLAPGTVPQLRHLAAENLHFRDPFNDVRDRSLVEAILLEMFQTSENPKFTIQRKFIDGSEAALVWKFCCVLKRPSGSAVEIEGMSRLVFDDQHRIAEHIDYWDAATYFYERVPLLGGCIRLIKRRLKIKTPAGLV